MHWLYWFYSYFTVGTLAKFFPGVLCALVYVIHVVIISGTQNLCVVFSAGGRLCVYASISHSVSLVISSLLRICIDIA